MRVLIYSTIRLFGDTLASCLTREQEITTVHTESDIDRLISDFDEDATQTDVILFDITSRSDVAAVRRLANRHSQIPIVALAVPRVADEVIACADAGFTSYIPRDSQYCELLSIVRMALRGETPCDPKISRSLLEEVARRRLEEPKPKATLTQRQTEILHHMTNGLSNKEIASELHVSVATVKNHVHAVYKKLDLKSRTEAVVAVRERPELLAAAIAQSRLFKAPPVTAISESDWSLT